MLVAMKDETIGKAERVTSLYRWQSLRSELLFIYDTDVPQNALESVGTRESEFSAWLLRNGTVRLTADGKTVTAKQGDWVVCFGKQVGQKFSPGAAILSLRVLQNWPDGQGAFQGGPLAVFRAADHPQVERTAMRILRGVKAPEVNEATLSDPRYVFLGQTRCDFDSFLRYECNLLTWIGALSKAMQTMGRPVLPPGETDPRLDRACQLINSVPVGDAFPERALTGVTGLSLGRLNYLFNQAYGWSAHAHWEKRRVNRARLALEQPDVRVKEVAAQLGFLQLSHFSAWFKRNTGASPRAYRRQVNPAAGPMRS